MHRVIRLLRIPEGRADKRVLTFLCTSSGIDVAEVVEPKPTSGGGIQLGEIDYFNEEHLINESQDTWATYQHKMKAEMLCCKHLLPRKRYNHSIRSDEEQHRFDPGDESGLERW